MFHGVMLSGSFSLRGIQSILNPKSLCRKAPAEIKFCFQRLWDQLLQTPQGCMWNILRWRTSVFNPLQEPFLTAKICFCKAGLLYLQHVWEKELCSVRKELIPGEMQYEVCSCSVTLPLVYLPLCGPTYIKRKLAFRAASCRESASDGWSSSSVSRPAWKCFHLSN